jgi:hypothetical protein
VIATHPLAALLARLRWRPEQFGPQAQRVSPRRRGRAERVHLKAPYKWLAGDVPRTRWPTLVRALLAELIGTPPRDRVVRSEPAQGPLQLHHLGQTEIGCVR